MTDKARARGAAGRFRSVANAAFGTAFFLAMVFLPAGRVDWVAGWVYVGLLSAGWWINHALVARSHPELLKRREQSGEGTPAWDRGIQGLVALVVLALFIVAGLDAGRFGWSDMPFGLSVLGGAFHIAGYALIIWSMLTNEHFEGAVRVQEDRAHRVVCEGPYRYTRHPGYVGFALLLLAIPLVLGSWWSFLPTAAALALLVARTTLEDRHLMTHLEGYQAYAKKVPRKLLW